MVHIASVIAQTTGRVSAEILQWLLVIVVLAVVIIGVALVVRRWLLGGEEVDDSPGFLLSDLRRMHERGELSDEEFAAAKARMIAQNRALLHEEESDVADEGRPFPTDVGEADTDADRGTDDGDDEDTEPGSEADSDKSGSS